MLIPFPITGNRTVFSVLAGIGFKSRAAFYTSIIQHSGGKVLFSPPSRSTATGTEFFLSFMGQLYQGFSAIRTSVLFFSSEIRFDCIGRDTEGFCNFSCLFSCSKHLWNDFFLTLCHRKYLLLSSYGEKTAIWVQKNPEAVQGEQLREMVRWNYPKKHNRSHTVPPVSFRRTPALWWSDNDRSCRQCRHRDSKCRWFFWLQM